MLPVGRCERVLGSSGLDAPNREASLLIVVKISQLCGLQDTMPATSPAVSGC
jgi:hypothetical protein